MGFNFHSQTCVYNRNGKEAKVVTLTGKAVDMIGAATCKADSCPAIAAHVFAVGGREMPSESAGSDVVMTTEGELAAS